MLNSHLITFFYFLNSVLGPCGHLAFGWLMALEECCYLWICQFQLTHGSLFSWSDFRFITNNVYFITKRRLSTSCQKFVMILIDCDAHF